MGSTTRSEHAPDGLTGEWISAEDLSQIEFFQGKKRAFKLKLNTNLGLSAGTTEPGIKAAVRRVYEKGEFLCQAGEYGSTAFLLLEGTATSYLPSRSTAAEIPGRTRRSYSFLKTLFRRHTAEPTASGAGAWEIGEVSRYASLDAEPRLDPVTLEPGDFFGIDTCINFYPRETTVQAEERCVAVEMLRSVLDTIRDAGKSGSEVNARYREQAIRNTLDTSSLFRDLGREELEFLASSAELLTPDSDEIRDDVVYTEGESADALFLVRAGHIKLSRKTSGGEFIFAYLGRGSAFGLEPLLPRPQGTRLVLRCTSHPSQVPAVDLDRPATLGRSTGCEAILPSPDASVSRKHARLEPREGSLVLRDLDSVNHTFLNGEQIHEATVHAGDRIRIVDYEFDVATVPVQTEDTSPVPRVATTTGLDNFEAVRVSADAVRQVLDRDPERARKVASNVRELEAEMFERRMAEQSVRQEIVDLNLYNSQNVLLIDLDRCTRCDECVRACSDAHDGVARFTRDGPRFGKYLVTMACRSCTDPKCMIGCPVSSIRRTESLEVHIEDWCIGCERCANQCPFGNINMVNIKDMANPPPEREGVSMKATVCDLCSGYDGPNCVYACPHDAAIRVEPKAFASRVDGGRGIVPR